MKKTIKLFIFYIFQVYLFSPISFAAGEKEIEKTGTNTNALFNIFSTDLLLDFLFIIVVILVTFTISRFVNNKMTNYFERTAGGGGANKEELIGVVTRVTNIGFILIGITIILSVVGIDIGIFMGGIGFGLGFTLKIFLTNFVAGILMVSQGFYHNGDLVEIGGKKGKIKIINALFTSIEQFNGVILYVPNVKFLEENVENYHTNDKRRTDVDVLVDYDVDIVKAKKIMLNVVENFSNILKAPYSEVLVDELGDNGINLRLRYWVNSTDNNYFDTKSNITETINLAFKQHGIIIAFPQVTISNRK